LFVFGIKQANLSLLPIKEARKSTLNVSHSLEQMKANFKKVFILESLPQALRFWLNLRGNFREQRGKKRK
jgi:hypothetical protein